MNVTFYTILFILIGSIEPISWHYFCKSISPLHNGKNNSNKLGLLLLIGFIIIKNLLHEHMDSLSVESFILNDLYIPIYILYGFIIFGLDAKLVLGCCSVQYILNSVFEYMYTFIIINIGRFFSIVDLSSMSIIRLVSIFILQCVTVLTLWMLYKMSPDLLDCFRENDICMLIAFILALDIVTFSVFCMLSNNNNIFNPTTFIAVIGESGLMIYLIRIILYKICDEKHYLQNIQGLNVQMNLIKSTNEKIEEAKQINHDMKGHLSSIKYYMDRNNYESAYDLVNSWFKELKLNSIKDRGSNLTHAILYDKMEYAKQQGIDFNYMIAVTDVKIPMHDFISIITNMTNNAIEACLKIPDKKNRFIYFRIGVNNGNFIIECSNSTIKEDLVYDNGKKDKIISTKKNKDEHGYGIEIINHYTHKYGGSVALINSHSSFIIQSCFPENYADISGGCIL